MELAKVTSKGQITVPAAIRKLLDLNVGDKMAFFKVGGRVNVINAKSIETGELRIE
ncbi:MAG: AbrB/MazE/SpoVT family DNA-binding domain-containing protein [Thermoplasmatales archaeon]|nr:AbrB/MazE/SpoVT family DNA-binding domain-containing protein [Thermoplasmatales archaeon]